MRYPSVRSSIHIQTILLTGFGIVFYHLFWLCPASQAQTVANDSIMTEESVVTEESTEQGLPSLETNSTETNSTETNGAEIDIIEIDGAETDNPGINSPETVNPGISEVEVNDAEIGSVTNSRYILGTGDEVQVTVFNAPDYSGEFSVLAGGALNLPLAGEIIVAGLTLPQASEKISAQLGQYVRRPRVTVSLMEARPLQVAIAGEVNRPGAYTMPIEGENGSSTPTLTQVISLAGGITQTADIRQISVQRQLPGNEATVSDREITVNLWQLLQEGRLDADLALQRGDRIIIPEAVALSPEESTELASTSFSPTEIAVNVVGEVENPGSILLPPNAPFNQAILSAGGFNQRARQSTVGLVRLNDNGTVTSREIEIDFEAGLNSDNNPALKPNDTIVVGANGLSRVTDTLGTILAPINSGFGIFRLFGL